MLIKGSSTTADGRGEVGGGGLDRRSARGRGEGAPSMRSERGGVDMIMERMVMGDEMKCMAFGCLL